MRRLDQLLASLGYGSRREIATFISDGRVQVQGVPALRADHKADPSTVTFDGEPLDAPNGLLVLYHKPLGVVCSHNTAEGPTIYDQLPSRWLLRNPPLTSIGRLDKDTSGLLLLTDQGPLVHRLTSPKSRCEKTYALTVDRDLDPSLVETFARGDLLLRSETTPCLPAQLQITSPRAATLTLTEGRYHQVRRMFASQGYHVVTLHRTRFGDYHLGDLAVGQWKLLQV